ncbi:MAG: thioredoxin domain-containing protein, partial [Candidatus Aenigmatarchaeota archaeon]
CPFCSRFYSDAYQKIITEYVDTGKAKIVYRDFPLSFHPQAQPAAEAAECAGEQGMFWEYHDKIFENQGALSTESYKQWAADLGLNTEQFNSCFDSGTYRSEVQKDFADGQAAGVSGTPTFFINGQKLVGAQPFEAFKGVIDQLL